MIVAALSEHGINKPFERRAKRSITCRQLIADDNKLLSVVGGTFANRLSRLSSSFISHEPNEGERNVVMVASYVCGRLRYNSLVRTCSEVREGSPHLPTGPRPGNQGSVTGILPINIRLLKWLT